MDITVFLGAPGSGKGTQAKLLERDHGLCHFSTGDMLRSAIQAGDRIGLRAKQYIDSGELVADDVMITLIQNALGGLEPNSRVILDGFPRTLAQALTLDRGTTTKVARAVFFEIDRSVLISRLTGRRLCTKCGAVYNISLSPPKVAGSCDLCGGTLVHRADDSESVISNRLRVFDTTTKPLIDYYRDTDRLLEVDADQPIDSIHQALVGILR